MSYKKGVLQVITSTKYKPPIHKAEFANLEVNALIKPNGKFICIEITTNGSELGAYHRIDIPKEIIEREMSKF